MSAEKTAGRWRSIRQQLWAFLNSNFGLFFFSSVVLSSVTWSYAQWSAAIEQRSANTENITKLNTEIDYRIRLIENYFASECTEGSNVDLKTLSEIRNLYSAGPKYRSIFPENKQKQLHLLIWEMSALQEDAGQKQVFVKSFERLTRLYAYLNRFVEQSEVEGQPGWSYSGPPDYRHETKKIQQCFSAATASISQTLGFDTSSAPGTASPPALDFDACSKLDSANPAAAQTNPLSTGEVEAQAPPETADISSAKPDLENIEELLGFSDTAATAE